MKKTIRTALFCIPLLFAACGTTKNSVSMDKPKTAVETTKQNAATKAEGGSQLAFMEKVNDRKLSETNIVASLNFTATAGDKDVSVPGRLSMRRDKVIRIQLFIPIIGSEVGRLEFTPDYVLVVDRLHKQYVKDDYNKVDFLRDNGINFYSLQALFWNELFLPGSKTVGEADLSKFVAAIDGSSQTVPITLKNGKMSFLWDAARQNGQINDAKVTYTSAGQGTSSLTWQYSDFQPVGTKSFPSTQEFSFKSSSVKKGQKVTVNLDMDGVKTKDNWDTETVVSNKYKQVDAKTVLGKLLSE